MNLNGLGEAAEENSPLRNYLTDFLENFHPSQVLKDKAMYMESKTKVGEWSLYLIPPKNIFQILIIVEDPKCGLKEAHRSQAIQELRKGILNSFFHFPKEALETLKENPEWIKKTFECRDWSERNIIHYICSSFTASETKLQLLMIILSMPQTKDLINQKGCFGTPLTEACHQFGDYGGDAKCMFSITEKLIEAKADVNVSMQNYQLIGGLYPYSSRSNTPVHPSILELLLKSATIQVLKPVTEDVFKKVANYNYNVSDLAAWVLTNRFDELKQTIPSGLLNKIFRKEDKFDKLWKQESASFQQQLTQWKPKSHANHALTSIEIYKKLSKDAKTSEQKENMPEMINHLLAAYQAIQKIEGPQYLSPEENKNIGEFLLNVLKFSKPGYSTFNKDYLYVVAQDNYNHVILKAIDFLRAAEQTRTEAKKEAPKVESADHKDEVTVLKKAMGLDSGIIENIEKRRALYDFFTKDNGWKELTRYIQKQINSEKIQDDFFTDLITQKLHCETELDDDKRNQSLQILKDRVKKEMKSKTSHGLWAQSIDIDLKILAEALQINEISQGQDNKKSTRIRDRV